MARRGALILRSALGALVLLAEPSALVQAKTQTQPQPHEKAAEPSPTPTNTTNRFDGDWTIRVDCPANSGTPAAKPVAVDFPASVLNGKLFGSHLAQGTPGSMQVDGAIGADGNAQLQAHGSTGNPENAQQPPPGTPYSYDINAHFDPAHGSGTRVQERVCNYTFTRR